MNKQTVLSLVALVGLSAAAFEERAMAARIAPASTGRARVSEQGWCFDFNYDTGAVDSFCNADFIVPLTTDNSGTKSLNFTSRATSAGAQCRAVANNRFATSVSASPWRSVSVSDTYTIDTTGEVVVPSMGVFFAHCVTNVGASLARVYYSP